MWQDYVLAFANWFFLVALIPTIRHPTDKPPLLSSVSTGLMVMVVATTFGTLQLWSSAISALTLGVAWLYIGFQKWNTLKAAP